MRLLFLLFITTALSIQAQTDSVNSINDKLLTSRWANDTRSYLIYFQDSLNAPKHNMEIWDRATSKHKNDGKQIYQLDWSRSFSNKSYALYVITADENLIPLEESVHVKYIIDKTSTFYHKHYLYEDNHMYTDKDTLRHNIAPSQVDDLKHSFNWEMDMEIYSMLPLAAGKRFVICFYHPGSTTLPAYYEYRVVRDEKIHFNGEKHACWVLQIDYEEDGSKSEFWIDKHSHEVLKMRDSISNGGYRFKLLLPY